MAENYPRLDILGRTGPRHSRICVVLGWRHGTVIPVLTACLGMFVRFGVKLARWPAPSA